MKYTEWTGKRIGKYVGAGLFVLTLGVVGARSCTTVSAGHVAVQSVFGNVQERELESGLNFPVHPLANRIEMSIRTQEVKEAMPTPTNEGLITTLDISILYKLQADKADEVYRTIGADYTDVVIRPQLRNVVRDVVAGFNSADLYSANRARVSSQIFDKLKESYGERGITLEQVLIRDLKLPEEVTNAIERKMREKQAAEQMEFTLQRERLEKDRKVVEAEGIAEAQRIIADGLTPQYLQWRYITTLQGLAESDNTTFVITPYGQDLLPMIQLNEQRTQIRAPTKRQ